MSFPFTSACARASIVAISIALLAGCAGAGGGRSGSFGAVPAMSSQTGLFSFGSNAPVLQTLDVPLSQFPNAVGTLLTGIRGNLITGFIDNINGSNLGVVYDRKTGVWTPIKYPRSAKTSVYGPAITQTGYRLVGSYEKKGQTNADGFVYDSTTKKYLTLDAPANLCAPKSCNYTIVHSNYGNATYKAVGNYDAVKSGSTLSPFGYVSGFGTCIHLRFGHHEVLDARISRLRQLDGLRHLDGRQRPSPSPAATPTRKARTRTCATSPGPKCSYTTGRSRSSPTSKGSPERADPATTT